MFHILVVDDDKSTRRLIRAILEAEYYTVYLAQNGVEALKVMEQNYIDLVVLDVMMPEMDGYEFAKAIRAAGNEIPILMVSAKYLPENRCMCFLAGTDDFIAKPIDEDEFLLRIKALLRRAKIASEKKIVVGDVVLNFDALSVSRKEEIQVLPQKEFLLLYKLLSFPGRIFTRIELMDEVWGTESETGWETVTVHIGRLRKRFEHWPEFDIVSVRGLGYKAVKNV